MGLGRSQTLSLVLVALMVAVAWTPMLSVSREAPILEQPATTAQKTVRSTDVFTQANGFTHLNLTVPSATGLTTLERPSVSWTATSGFGLMSMRTGACSAYLPSTNEVFLIGGRIDIDPTQTGDEANTKSVEILDMVNKTWSPAIEELKESQQFHGCAVIGDKIYAVGDHHPFSNPALEAAGLVQVYDANAGNWSYGTSMPGNQSVGLAGVASQGGMLYVAGGVTADDRSDSTDRLLRYDPVNDTWTQLASMNNRRHSFELVSFRGKLIAYGGVAVFYDPITNMVIEEETNLTEAYDPATNTWSQLPNATHAFSAYAATVFNDEIIVHGGYSTSGWSGAANDKTYGYDPFTNEWNVRTTLQIGMYDSTLVLANNTLVYAGGDATNSRFSTWNTQYLAENEYHVNPATREGWLTSPIQDLRSNQHGSASLLWLQFATSEPSGTTMGLQYRTAFSVQDMGAAPWLPTTVPVNTYVSAGNQSLIDIPEDAPFLQYRVKYATTRLLEWVTPTLENVTVGADAAAFEAPPPASMQPTSSPVTITTKHDATTQNGTYVLAVHPTDALGDYDDASDWLVLEWNTTTAALTVDDPNALLFNQQATAVPGVVSADGQTMNWTFSLNNALPTDHLKFKTSTHAARNTTYVYSGITAIDRDVTVTVDSVLADASSQGNASVEVGEVLPGNTALNIAIDHRFTNSGLRLLGSNIEGRLHLDLQSFDEDDAGQRIWVNESSDWFTLPAGALAETLLNVPEALSGEANLWFEARTSEDWNLSFDTTPLTFIINGEGPTLLEVSPPLDAYTNEEVYRTVSFTFHDVGGFSAETMNAFTWLEARDDGTNGAPADGVPQRDEYQPALFYTQHAGNRWNVNITVNDTINGDHQWGRVLLEGTDLAGYALPFATPADGHARWESRTPTKGTLLDFAPTVNLLNDSFMRIEPSQQIGWRVSVSDGNGLEDLSEVRLELGNDESLGVKYTALDNTCSTLDERLLMLPGGCTITTVGDVRTIEFTASVQWSLTAAGLAQGDVDVVVKDYDGTQRYAYTESWVIEREMSINVDLLADRQGPVQQNLTSTSVVMAGEDINMTAHVAYRSSGTPYTGDLRLRWDGLLQGEPWRGGSTVSIVDGLLDTAIPTPERSGLVQDMTLMLWDPLETEMLSTYELPVFRLDADAPVVLPSAISDTISRYHLDNVEVGVNIVEEQGWSSPLALTCQIRSFSQSWEPITLVRNATTVFDGKTMFSFQFDFSNLGDPSKLSEQANLACWATGADDAGWTLEFSSGNSELDPWLQAPLNNIGPDLALENVELSGELTAGSEVRLSFLVTNGGETLDTPFNATIELVQGDQRTMVGRSVFYSMDANTAKSVKRSFTAPEGEWTIEITVDKEALIWEIDETNNVWNRSVTGTTDGIGATTLALAGGGLLALIGAGVLLQRGRGRRVDTAEFAAALEATGEGVAPTAGARPPVVPSVKPRGPPGKKVAAQSAKSPSKAPPRGPPKSKKRQPELTPRERAAAHMAALGEPAPSQQRVDDYSKLPGGGEYEYTAEATYYVGPTCGRWILNEDKSFTKVEDGS